MDRCVKSGCEPKEWQTEGDLQVRRCAHCNKILVVASIPQPMPKPNECHIISVTGPDGKPLRGM